MKTLYVFDKAMDPYGLGDRVLNEQEAVKYACALSVTTLVPYFVAASREGHVAVGQIGHVDAEVYTACIGLAWDGEFIATKE